MLTKEGIDALRERLGDLTDAAAHYFEKAEPVTLTRIGQIACNL